ncbi:serine hydrolase [bacterium]|nr:serine hydrolase [bacterium]
MKSVKAFALLLLVYMLAATAPAGSQSISSVQIDSLVLRTMRTFDVPGIAVAVVKDDSVVHAEGYGVRSLRTGLPVDRNTLFGIASNSKAFTTTALGILVDEGALSWDDPVVRFIPEFTLYDDYVTREFTIRDLLTHRSGLGLGAGDLMIFPDSSDFTIDELIHNLRFLKPVSSFRSKFDYDNLLYIVAGEVIARVSGMSWSAFVEERIMDPLQMTMSRGNVHRLAGMDNVADAHAPVNGVVRVVDRYDLELTSAAGGIYSSAAELCNWVRMHLREGCYGDGQRLVSSEVHRAMWTPQTLLRAGGGGFYRTHFRAYALGWGVRDINGLLEVSHTGGLLGMVTQVSMVPEIGLGIIVLTNQQSAGAFASITDQIKDAFLGVSGTDHVAENHRRMQAYATQAQEVVDGVMAEVAAVKEKSGGPAVALTSFTGRFRDDWFGEIIISERDGRLHFLSLRSPKLKGWLDYYKDSTWIVQWLDRSMDADAFVMFHPDDTGRFATVTMKAVSPLTDFSYDFQDLYFTKVQ